MTDNCETIARKILEQVRKQIKAAAGKDSANWFKINRYVYARLLGDERKKKPKKADLFDRQKGVCAICKKQISNIKDIDTHRINDKLGYDDTNNVVLVHRSCHQQMQAKKT